MKKATKDMRIIELINIDEDIAPMLMESGMHCLGCMMASAETLEQACSAHGIDVDVLIEKINNSLDAKASSEA